MNVAKVEFSETGDFAKPTVETVKSEPKEVVSEEVDIC